jgi:hypothetical protein
VFKISCQTARSVPPVWGCMSTEPNAEKASWQASVYRGRSTSPEWRNEQIQNETIWGSTKPCGNNSKSIRLVKPGLQSVRLLMARQNPGNRGYQEQKSRQPLFFQRNFYQRFLHVYPSFQHPRHHVCKDELSPNTSERKDSWASTYFEETKKVEKRLISDRHTTKPSI